MGVFRTVALLHHLGCAIAWWPNFGPSETRQRELDLLERQLAVQEKALALRERELLSSGEPAQLDSKGDVLIFSDEFENGFNLDIWKHELTMSGGGNWEFQYYTNNRTNSYVKDGRLHLQPTLTEDFIGADNVAGRGKPFTMDLWGLTPPDQCTSNMFYGCYRTSDAGSRIAINPVQSARVRTAGTFAFRYGRVEVRAKLPKGDWLWPAIWMLPETNVYGSWPASGEIDIMEARGNAPGYAPDEPQAEGVDAFSTAIHWGPHFSMDKWDKTFAMYKLPEGTFHDDFHTFGLYWDKDQMYSYVDSDENRVLEVDFTNHEKGFWEKGGFEEEGIKANPWVGRGVSAPYDQHFYLVFNVAVGGVSGFFPDDVGGKCWHNKDRDAAMKFFEHTDKWYPTWGEGGKDAAMVIDSVKVWQKAQDYYKTSFQLVTEESTKLPPNAFEQPTSILSASPQRSASGVGALLALVAGGAACVMVGFLVRAYTARAGGRYHTLVT